MPDADVQALVARALRQDYDVDVTAVQPLAGGQDLRARVYLVEADAPTARFVVKTRPAEEAREVAAAVAGHVAEIGVPHVLAPIRSAAGDASVRCGDVALTVFPFVDGRTGADGGLTDDHWRALGVFVRELHGARLPADLGASLERETYRRPAVDLVRRVDRLVARRTFSDPLAARVAAFWDEHRDDILPLADRTEELGARVAARSLPLVLCHGDLHTWNVIVDGAGGLWVADWDEVVLAPKERDLMFVVGGIGAGLVTPHQTACFLAGYRDDAIDALALSYYRHAWAVQDVGGYAERVLVASSLTDDVRAEAARILIGLFARGEIVDLARGSGF